jgi:hypothetical protein
LSQLSFIPKTRYLSKQALANMSKFLFDAEIAIVENPYKTHQTPTPLKLLDCQFAKNALVYRATMAPLDQAAAARTEVSETPDRSARTGPPRRQACAVGE